MAVPITVAVENICSPHIDILHTIHTIQHRINECAFITKNMRIRQTCSMNMQKNKHEKRARRQFKSDRPPRTPLFVSFYRPLCGNNGSSVEVQNAETFRFVSDTYT